ncbi:MAG: cardiolipin synthase ClsB [Hydrogenophilales bacterium]|nr:cardiolipin synthase ClsB [Hydrogenophilales bacterium]
MHAGNRLTLLENGAGYFPALLDAIAHARREIHLESYIFEMDDIGLRVAHALIDAAERGVQVRVLVDGIGSKDFSEELRDRMLKTGIALLFYRPEISPWRLKRARLRRMHRKIVVIDACLAYIGGINIVDDRTGQESAAVRYDAAVRVEGPVLADICKAVDRLWLLVRWSRLRKRPAKQQALPACVAEAGDQNTAFLERDTLRHRDDIEKAYLTAIAGARREIIIANAYFLPGRRFRKALVDATERGVRVVLLLQGRSDHRLVRWASRALYGYFLDRGVGIVEYHASEMHAKVAVIDDEWSTVGSSNIDPFSLMLAREANLVIRDAEFNRELRASLLVAIERGGVAMHRRTWAELPWHQRAGSWLVYGAVRWIISILGYGHLDAA